MKRNSYFQFYVITTFLVCLVYSSNAQSGRKLCRDSVYAKNQKIITSQIGGKRVKHIQGEILIKLKHTVLPDSFEKSITSRKGRISRPFDKEGFGKITFPDSVDLVKELLIIRESSMVMWADLNEVGHAQLAPNDPFYGEQWGLWSLEIAANHAWEFTTGSSDIILAILDSGVDTNHGDLISRCILGKDFIDDDDVPNDQHGHGTEMAGIVGAVTNNGVGVAGTTWGCRLLIVRVLDKNANGTVEDFRDGVKWIVDNYRMVKIINASLGWDKDNDAIGEAVVYAYQNGVLILAAAGNDGNTPMSHIKYPAAYPSVLAVGGSDNTRHRWVEKLGGGRGCGPCDEPDGSCGSEHSNDLDILAPAENIRSTSIPFLDMI